MKPPDVFPDTAAFVTFAGRSLQSEGRSPAASIEKLMSSATLGGRNVPDNDAVDIFDDCSRRSDERPVTAKVIRSAYRACGKRQDGKQGDI